MKKLVNCYSYDKIYEQVIDKTDNFHLISHNSCLSAEYPKRSYKTKMNVEDLPEYYCDVQRYSSHRNVISAKGIVNMKYTWIPENHFMKDSVLRISYTDVIEPYYDKFTYEGKVIESKLVSYNNVDQMVFGNDIYKFLAYAHKYSGYDLTEIRQEIINQCEWLSINEPPFAPDLNGLKDYGEWFDNIIKKY